jgi:SAM-dependent methyltransferase
MMWMLFVIGALVVLLIGVGLLWRFCSLPCPARFAWILENPYTRVVAGSSTILDRLDLQPGMRVLDAGCGPGRVALPAARRLGSKGSVIGLDIQSAMLKKLRTGAERMGLKNIRAIRAGLGHGVLREDVFDRALLVTVLGEIPDRGAALNEIYRALRPGGILSVTEILPDPHYQRRSTVKRLCGAAGFSLDRAYGNWFAFTLNFVKPLSSPVHAVGGGEPGTGDGGEGSAGGAGEGSANEGPEREPNQDITREESTC